MSRRQRADKNNSVTVKEIAIFWGLSIIPLIGPLIAVALITKKLAPLFMGKKDNLSEPVE
jgi:hypothetical protein